MLSSESIFLVKFQSEPIGEWQTINKMDNSPLNTRVSPEYAYHFFWQNYKVMKSLVSLATFALSTSITLATLNMIFVYTILHIVDIASCTTVCGSLSHPISYPTPRPRPPMRGLILPHDHTQTG